MTDLTTRYLGFDLASPLVASAGPLTGQLETLVELEAAGAAAVVLPSLFEEDVERSLREYERVTTAGTNSFPEAMEYLPRLDVDPTGIDRHLRLVEEAKQELSVPVVASLNGVSVGGWTQYAQLLVDAGADALELNVYFVAADVDDVAHDVEARYEDLVRAVRDIVDVPLAVKIGPFFTAAAHVAHRLVGAGADGLVLFNRFYQPDIDVDTLTVTPTMALSTSEDLRLPLRWIALLAGRVQASLAASGGVHTAADVVRALLAGADVAMSTSALLRHGPAHLDVLRTGLREWMEEREYDSVTQLRASMSAAAVPDPDAFARAGYVETLRRHAARSRPSSW